MTSNVGSWKIPGGNSPQERPTISTESLRSLAWHDLRQFSRQRGYLEWSERVTTAPHIAAKMPGRAVPAPSCEI